MFGPRGLAKQNLSAWQIEFVSVPMSQPPQSNASVGPANTSKDVSSMSSILMGPLNELQGLSQTLFLSLSPPQTKPPPPPPLDAFLQCDKVLASAINVAQTHQIKQRKIEALETEILELEMRWRNICEELAKGRKELEELIEEGEERLKAIEQAKKGVQSKHMYGYAHFNNVCSFHSLPRTTCICAELERVHFGTSEYARPQPSRPATSTFVFPSVSQRREDAAGSSQCRGASWLTGRNAFSWKTYVILPLLYACMSY